MTAQGFIEVLKHIKNNTRCSKEKPIILFLDNHVSHCSLTAIIFCRENGIHMITFPPHTSHKLQPLDVSVFGPFKKYLATSFNDFLVSNPGRIITIYDVPSLTNIPFRKAFAAENICKGFEMTGISPFNRQIFPETDFINEPNEEHPTADNDNEPILQQDAISNEPDVLFEPPVTPPPLPKTPEQVRPLPRIQQSKSNKRKGKSTILTSTPLKEEKERTQQQKKQAPTAQIFYKKLIESTKIDATWDLIRWKVRHLKASYKKPSDWRMSTGAGPLESDDGTSSVEGKVLQMCPHFNQLKHIFGKKATSELPFEVVDSGSTSIMNESAASQTLKSLFLMSAKKLRLQLTLPILKIYHQAM
ncbi:uncharacterized protein LOC115065987 [Bactrocera dorsalis]|uniref:Uncharacterized protein LOC115065987 n=1 Tax=Bactrocera dorsalis TaxID=27457 RepID=A0ABM3K2N0_BACDO|nr:uncharacterized protein LOC115065987 [Bactrocera dorsalis]XP_049315729.1 uncharacterized protein LOC115065987 [Bactrocera dorsalis]XP_049315730.1 uncharacterized protein LOC115065987 [Bactrocera dorsalis]XP_049315731.1 uncharacterized protein LOC115065987 [Bactrocera dorsalis]